MRRRMQQTLLVLPFGLLGVLWGCAGTPASPATPEEPNDSSDPSGADPSGADPSGANPSSAPAVNQDFSSEEEAALAEIDAAGAEEPPGTPQRQVVYRLTQQGLHVEVEGADFAPSAKSKKVAGGLGLELTVKATSSAPLMLLSPEAGPMAFGGKVRRASGSVETFGDQRKDARSLPLAPDIPQSFSRTWPIDGVSPLKPGDELELHVGLWGLGPNEATRRPVRKFVIVKMTASREGGVPLIEPPAR